MTAKLEITTETTTKDNKSTTTKTTAHTTTKDQ